MANDHYYATQRTTPPSSLRAFLFLLGFGITSFGTAAFVALRDTAELADEVRSASSGPLASLSSFFSRTEGQSVKEAEVWGPGVTEGKLRAAGRHRLAERLGARMEWIVGWCDQLGLPHGVREAVGRCYILTAEAYLNLPPSKEVLVPIVAANTVIFALWRLSRVRPRLASAMMRHFLHRPASGRVTTLLSSTYSHYGGLHFLFNNLALWSFGGGALVVAAYANRDSLALIPVASRTPEFLAFFATAGVFAATVSHAVTALRFRRVAALQGLEVATRTVGRHSSLGASGAVYATVVMSALAFPENRVGIIFLPFISLPIGTGVSCMVLFDLVMALRGASIFDHWAHLGGALFGLLYYRYGSAAWEKMKAAVLSRMEVGRGRTGRVERQGWEQTERMVRA